MAERIIPFPPKDDHAAGSRQGLVKELKLFGHQLSSHDVHTRHVLERPERAVSLGAQWAVEGTRHHWCRPRRNHETGAR
jgi:hypothetical protein